MFSGNGMPFILTDNLSYLFFLRQPVFPEKPLAFKTEEQGIFITDVKFLILRDFKQDCLWLMNPDPEITIMLQKILSLCFTYLDSKRPLSYCFKNFLRPVSDSFCSMILAQSAVETNPQ